jgi:paraquat-inducible protein B
VAEEAPPDDGLGDIPAARVASPGRRRLSLVWLLPVIAALIGGWFGVEALIERGTRITISFLTAEGIEPGKTRIKYKNVDVGAVEEVALSPDRKRVLITARVTRQVADLLREDTRFWVVRPRVSPGNVSGWGTLLAGSYINMEPGRRGAGQHDFIGQEQPSLVAADVPGREFLLRAKDIGSLDIGSPIYFRRLPAGQVLGFTPDRDGRAVIIKAFINAPFDAYVNSNSRFWHSRGIDITLDANGVRVSTGSWLAILLGGLAFETPENAPTRPLVEGHAVFEVHADRTMAMRAPDVEAEVFRLLFRESVRGLAPGAPVDFRGVVVGEVVSINVDVDQRRRQVSMPVDIKLHAQRLAERSAQVPSGTANAADDLVARLVEKGFRAQLRSGNLITGQLYVALDFFPQAPAAVLDRGRTPPELPTVPGNLQALEQTLLAISRKLEKVPIDALGNELQRTLSDTRRVLHRLEGEVAPQAQAALLQASQAMRSLDGALNSEGPLQQEAREALREFGEAAKSLRLLADYLERHPEALLRGKREEQP